MPRFAEMAPKCLLGSLVKKEDSLKVALMLPKHGTEGEKENIRRGEEGVGRDRGRTIRHLINTAQCPCYGQMYLTGSCTYRRAVLEKNPCTIPCNIPQYLWWGIKDKVNIDGN